MKLKELIQARTRKWPYAVIVLLMAISAFGAYTSMYAYRKGFSAATYDGQRFFGVDYKVWLIIFQVIGYTCAKFYGIRFISGLDPRKRGRAILTLIAISWSALLLFALIPAPWNILLLLVNGFPLGMIWGLVFGYLEGRKATEFMAAVMSVSLVFASGLVKTIGRTVMDNLGIGEFWMPFTVGLLFAIPMLLFVGILECLPPPSEEDIKLRTERKPMNAADRKNFVQAFLPGIAFTLVIYILLTITRDIRDNFEVEIWHELGVKGSGIYTRIDSIIAIIALITLSLLIFIKNNFRAFTVIHLLIISGCLLTGVATWMFNREIIGGVMWMSLSGIGLYLAYIPYNAIFFERMIATFRGKGNVGFIMYIADAAGYLGSVSILLFKEFGIKDPVSWTHFFKQGLFGVSSIGALAAIFSFFYFLQKKGQQKKTENNLQILPL